MEGEQTGEMTLNQGKEKKEGGGGTDRRGGCNQGKEEGGRKNRQER